MADTLHDTLVERGFTRMEIPGNPAQLRWFHRPMSWREKLPLVRGYTRTVVVVDTPIASGERVEDLFSEVARLACTHPQMLREQEQLARRMPWYAVPLYLLSFVVGLAAAYFVGISLEMEDYRTCLVLFTRERLGEEAQAAIVDCAVAGDGLLAWSALWDARAQTIIDPPRGGAQWGAARGAATAAVRATHRLLAGDVQVEARHPVVE